ncbi:hypothetical protein PMAYCL1PPCAC_10523, partial [Pristionchus mayeri]
GRHDIGVSKGPARRGSRDACAWPSYDQVCRQYGRDTLTAVQIARRMLTNFQHSTRASLHAFIPELQDIIAIGERTIVLCLPPIAA